MREWGEKERIFCVIRPFRGIRVNILSFEKTMNSKLCSIAYKGLALSEVEIMN